MGFGNFFKAALPYLSTAVGLIPGGGPAVKIAAGILSKTAGKEVLPEQIEDVLNDLSTTEEGRLKLQESEQEYQKAMTQLGFDHVEKLAELGNADRDSARKREMTVRDKVPAILALLVTLGFFGMLLLICLRGIPPEAHDFVVIMLTSLGTAWVSIIAYYFGSSAGSDRKTDIIATAPPVSKGATVSA